MPTVPNATPGPWKCPDCKKTEQLYFTTSKKAKYPIGCAECLGEEKGYPIPYPPPSR